VKRAIGRLLGVLCLAPCLLSACAAPPERILQTAAGRRAPEAEVDGDPWRLLPGGAVAWAHFDAQALARASFGAEANQLFVSHLPLSGGKDFDLGRDVDEMMLGVYATAGADVAAVARGRFDPARIAQAIAQNPKTQTGQPIQTNPFAGQVMYVSDGWAMVPVTSKTLVFGTEIGVRRVLERIEVSRLNRVLPAWYEQMLSEKAATLAIGIDLDAQPVPSVVRTRLVFLQGLRAGRLLGNFAEPGLNLAGTLSYDSPQSAQRAAVALEAQADALRRAELLLALLKMPRPLRRLEARATGKDTQVVVEVDGRAIAAVLTRTDEVLQQLELEAPPAAATTAAPATP